MSSKTGLWSIVLFALCLGGGMPLHAKTDASVRFFTGSYNDLRSEAYAQNKPYFINFYTDWCTPCENIRKFSFTDPTLAGYVNQHYLAYNVDAESLSGDGVALAQRFGVLFYPTIIVVSPTGETLEQLSGYQSGHALLKVLKKYGGKAGSSTNSNSNSNSSSSSSTSTNTASGPITDTQAALTRNLTENASASSAILDLTTPSSPSPVVTNTSKPGQGLFRLVVNRETATGFGYQLGVFSDYANVLKEAEKLRAKNQRHVLVYISELNGKTVFKLILGPFSTRESAGQQRQVTGREGMVVSLVSLR